MFHTDSFQNVLSVAAIRKPEQPPLGDYVTREYDSSAQKQQRLHSEVSLVLRRNRTLSLADLLSILKGETLKLLVKEFIDIFRLVYFSFGGNQRKFYRLITKYPCLLPTKWSPCQQNSKNIESPYIMSTFYCLCNSYLKWTVLLDHFHKGLIGISCKTLQIISTNILMSLISLFRF